MASKPYAFRYPYDVQSSYDRWRTYLTGVVTGSQDYEAVISFLRDRDRAIEDYLSFGIGQGQLGIATQTTSPFLLPGARTAIPGMSVTATIPANRLIQVTVTVHVDVAVGPTPTTFIYADDNGTIVAQEFHNHTSASDGFRFILVAYYTPAAGTHIWTAQGGSIAANSTQAVNVAPSLNYIAVEDIGPASR